MNMYNKKPANARLLRCGLPTNDDALMLSPTGLLETYFLYHSRVIFVCLIFF